MHRVRWANDGEPELQCWTCHEFWPLTREFFQPARGLRVCVACRRDASNKRRAAARRRNLAVPAIRAAYDADRYRSRRGVLARFQRNVARTSVSDRVNTAPTIRGASQPNEGAAA